MSKETLSFEAFKSQLDPAVAALLQPDLHHAPTQVMPEVAQPITGNAITAAVTKPASPNSETLSFEAFKSQLDPAVAALLQPDLHHAPTQVMPEVAQPITGNAITAVLDKPVKQDAKTTVTTAAGLLEDWSAKHKQWLKDNKPSTDVNRELKASAKRVARRIGYASLAILGITAGAISYVEFGPRHETSAQVLSQPLTEEVVTAQSSEPTTTVTIPATPPETTATTASVPVFAPRPGEAVGVLVLPEALCGTEVQIGEYSESEDVNHVVGTGNAYIDQKIADPTPDDGCDARTEREKQHEAVTGTDFVGRPDRVRGGYYSSQNSTADGSSIGLGNPNGNANFWLPIAGHVTSVQGDGIYTSALPGNPGNTVISGHGSTFGAGFGDIGLMQAGDSGEFRRADGKNFRYEVIDTDVVAADQYANIINYSNPNYASTGSFFYCTGTPNGDPGTGDAYRGVVHVAFSPVNQSITIYK